MILIVPFLVACLNLLHRNPENQDITQPQESVVPDWAKPQGTDPLGF